MRLGTLTHVLDRPYLAEYLHSAYQDKSGFRTDMMVMGETANKVIDYGMTLFAQIQKHGEEIKLADPNVVQAIKASKEKAELAECDSLQKSVIIHTKALMLLESLYNYIKEDPALSNPISKAYEISKSLFKAPDLLKVLNKSALL